jgi:hypothetical protein
MTGRADLERRVHDALRGLPSPRAPETLLLRVMTAVRTARPWYGREWVSWPPVCQVASALLFATIVVATAIWLRGTEIAGLSELAVLESEWPARLSRTAHQAAATVGAAGLLWRAILAPIEGCLVTLVALTSMTCAATGALLVHVSAERGS